MTNWRKTAIMGAALLLALAICSSAGAKTIYTHDFETLPPGVSEEEALQKTPFGWVGSGKGKLWSLRLSKDTAAAGKYSMLVTVEPNNDPWGVHLASKPIPVTPGKEYKVTFDVYNVPEGHYNGRVDLYIEFWTEPNWWGETDYWSLDSWNKQLVGVWEGKTRVHSAAKSTTMGSWATITNSAVAPPEAKYMTVSFWTSRRVVKSYIDNVRVEEN